MKPLGLNREFDYSDYEAILDDGKRYEVLEGSLFVTPAPSPIHQRVSKRLQRQLEAYFEERALGEVFDAPIDLILSPHDIVQLDLVVVALTRIRRPRVALRRWLWRPVAAGTAVLYEQEEERGKTPGHDSNGQGHGGTSVARV